MTTFCLLNIGWHRIGLTQHNPNILLNFLISFHFNSLQTSKLKFFRMYLTSRWKTKVTIMGLIFVLIKTRNKPKRKKPDKTKLNQPEPPETTSKNCERTRTTQNFKFGEIWNFLVAFVFQISGPNAQIWVFCVKKNQFSNLFAKFYLDSFSKVLISNLTLVSKISSSNAQIWAFWVKKY